MELNKNTTSRGFSIITFKDSYDANCSIQKSSSASVDKIWFGVTDVELKQEVPDLESDFEGAKKFVPFTLPDNVLFSTRMHLTREQVKELLPYLQNFVETGDIYK